MVYVRDGQVLEKRSPWRFSMIAELFMAAISLLVVFFQTIFDPTAISSVRSSSSGNSRRGGGGGTGGGGSGRRGGRIVGMDNLQADHNARCGGGG
ncbi:Seleno protein SelK/SelG [Scenedesmus sp. NREL 46B-D3]|nr:Seleno protein SelK/SelG [Scenedesmus sp. NREL 46B-D3]